MLNITLICILYINYIYVIHPIIGNKHYYNHYNNGCPIITDGLRMHIIIYQY